MFEMMLIAYLAIQLVYTLYAKKQVRLDENRDDFLYALGHPITEGLPKKIRDRLLSSEEELRLRQLHPQKHLRRASEVYLSRKMGLIYLVLALGAFFAIIVGHDYVPAVELSAVIERPAVGEVAKTLNLTYAVEGEEGVFNGTLPLTVDPKLPTGDEALRLLESKVVPIIDLLLAAGDQPGHVQRDLNFDEQPFEEPVQVGYTTLTPDYLTNRGQLRTNQMILNEPYDISVLVTMTLSELQIENTYDFVAYRTPMSLNDELKMIDERIEVGADQVILPQGFIENEGIVSWKTSGVGLRSIQIFAMSAMLGVIIFVFRKEGLAKALDERQEMMLRDFPEVVSKLTMLINAGMTFGRAWHKIVMDYQERSVGKRPLYEEMVITTNQIQNGMPEREALEDFGRRTGNKEVIRLSAVLIQNLKRGSQSLTDALKQLSTEAWSIRTNNAKMLGEKASTKLLLPMGISFVTVIIIVLAPTLMSLNV